MYVACIDGEICQTTQPLSKTKSLSKYTQNKPHTADVNCPITITAAARIASSNVHVHLMWQMRIAFVVDRQT